MNKLVCNAPLHNVLFILCVRIGYSDLVCRLSLAKPHATLSNMCDKMKTKTREKYILVLIFLTALLYYKTNNGSLQVNFYDSDNKAIRFQNEDYRQFISNLKGKTHLNKFLLEFENKITKKLSSRNPRCYPDCKNRKNIIKIKGQRAAGLNDRLYLLSHFANLASYLCAYIIVDKPCKLLNVTNHGKGVQVSCDLNWSDFNEYKRYSNSGMEPDVMILPKNQITPPKIQLKGTNLELFEESVRLFENNTQFSWEIDTGFYSWSKKLQKYLTENLRPENTSYPLINSKTQVEDQLECISPPRYGKIVVTLAEKVMIKSGIKSEFGTLHIRRGDAIQQCNTEINRVKNYLECSLKKCDSDFPVILFTDEPSETYLKNISDVLTSLNHKMINGEKLITSVLETEVRNGRLSDKYINNFIQFKISLLIRYSSRYQMIQRRKENCNDCDDWICDDRKR